VRVSSLPESLAEDTLEFLSIELSVLEMLSAKIEKQSGTMFPEELALFFNEAGVPPQVSNQRAGYIVSVTGFLDKDENEVTAPDFLELLKESPLFQESPVDDSKLAIFSAIIFSEKMYETQKLFELAYKQRAALHESNIILDARPVFTKDKSEISSFVMLNILKLKFAENNRRKTLNLYLDQNDIETLQAQCETALAKIKAASKKLANSSGTNVYIPGMEE